MNSGVLVCFLAILIFKTISAIPTLHHSGLAAPGESGEDVNAMVWKPQGCYDHWIFDTTHKIDNFDVEYSWANFKNVKPVEFDEDDINGTRKFKRVKLLFGLRGFPFYDTGIEEVLIMEEGFINFERSPQEWNKDSQFVAPFMAQFNPINGTMSSVKYINTESSLKVQWNNMELKIFNKTRDTIIEEKFSFEATLTKAGAIIFKYKELPSQSVLKQMNFGTRPQNNCFAGIKYKVFRTHLGSNDQITMEQEINLDTKYSISNDSIIVLMPKNGCSANEGCETCVSLNNYSPDKPICGWYPREQKCAVGLTGSDNLWDKMQCNKTLVEDIDSSPGKNTEKTEKSDSSWFDRILRLIGL